MRFLVDENLPRGVAEVLLDAGHDVLDVARSPHRGASDQELWALAAKDGRAIVTRDLGFPLPASHSSPPGVVLLRLPSRMRRASIVRAVEQLLEAIDVHELQGMITVVEPGRIRRRRIGRR